MGTKIKPISIISTEGFGEFSAKDAVEKIGIIEQADLKIAEATQDVYGKEFYGGVLKQNTEQFAGKKVSEVKDLIKNWLAAQKHSDVLLELTNSPVRCRCGAECVVKILTNQWFLNYGDIDWKEQASKCLHSMSILPQEIQGEFDYVIGWLRERACARQHGLGTKLPWDKDWIVESLSDSVIYMAYYILAKFVNAGTITADKLSKEFFDYVLLGKGSSDDLSVPKNIVEEIRKEFSYFYPVDSRHSGRDLVPNHLTFFVLNHVAIFPEENWPLQIVVNGSVLMDGKKMSKSMGNIIPLRQAIRDYGADPIRLAIIISAELLQDADFNLESVSGIKNKLVLLLEECSKLKPEKLSNLEAEDKWIRSKLQSLISDVASSIEKMRLREGLHNIIFSFEGDLQWYLKRAKAKKSKIYTANAFKSKAYHSILEKMMDGQTNMGEIIKELIANKETSDIKKNPDFVQKTINDILSEPVEIRKTKLETPEFDEKSWIANELISLAKAEFGVDLQVFSESDSGIYDPKGKARHARPFKPAILIE